MSRLTADALARIERECAKYPATERQSAVMSALAIAQEEHGWLSNELLEEVSGGVDAAERLKRRLGVEFGETTRDGRFTLKEGECMGACGDAPVLIVNNRRMCSRMSDEKLDALIEELE